MKRYGILDCIQSIADLRDLSYENLNELCASLREFIVDHVSQTGGHLASNLGIVELAVALERGFIYAKTGLSMTSGINAMCIKFSAGRKKRLQLFCGNMVEFLASCALRRAKPMLVSADMLPTLFRLRWVWLTPAPSAARNIM